MAVHEDLIFIPSFLKIERFDNRTPVVYDNFADIEAKLAEVGGVPYILIMSMRDYQPELSLIKNAKAVLIVSFDCEFKQLDQRVFVVDGEKFDRFSLEYILDFINITSDLYNKILENAQIGISLSVEKEPNKLYGQILTFLRKATNAEAGTLYLMNEEHDKIFFVSSQNSRLGSKVFEKREIPFNKRSFVGYVCDKGETLNIPDAYSIPEDAPYTFNSDLDKRLNYKTVSIITVPMKTATGDVVGAVQLINKLDSESEEPVPFSDFDTIMLKSLSTLAAVSVENNNLLLETEKLLNNMIISSVKAIEQRDPITKGHSIRVSAYTMAILKHALEKPEIAGLYHVDKNTMKVAETASLLHDFGKVGVREKLLMKQHRFYPEELETMKWRIKYALVFMKDGSEEKAVAEEFLSKLDSLDIPRPHSDEENNLIAKAANIIVDANGEKIELVTSEELSYLNIQKGTFTTEERSNMEKHVLYSYELLNSIDWPVSLKTVPNIAASHHEKLDGSGYPFHKKADELGIIERVMAIADIYDALTAKDRPYKKAIPPEIAVSIIQKEVDDGKIDSTLFDVFTANREAIDKEVNEKIG
ncbi:GAF domain-containing protein [bacterium]|nr:GAF domain-containing protein [bacterium]